MATSWKPRSWELESFISFGTRELQKKQANLDFKVLPWQVTK
jgi:hypothetical protein